MNACTPRGHYFSPVRQFGQRLSFVKEVELEDAERQIYRWDHDNCLTDALTLSRLVRDNAYSTQYAARIVDHDDGERTVIYTLAAEGKLVYRLSPGHRPAPKAPSYPSWVADDDDARRRYDLSLAIASEAVQEPPHSAGARMAAEVVFNMPHATH